MPIEGFQEEFIVGAWHPFVDLHFDTSQLPLFSNISINKGRNWIILSSCTPFQQKGKGLVHQAYDVNLRSNNSNSVLDAIAFRGYILDPPVHSWSDSSTILNYWSKKNSQYNGVFSTVIIKNKGRELSFISDAFGISTLYYRKHGSLVLFSTNSRFLASADDNFDYISGRILLQCGSVYGNRTLIEGVNRVASGSIMMFFRETTTEQKWFSFDKLPEGTRVLNFAALHEIESAFQTAIQRCLRLQCDGYILPLSSGYDSRRILAALQTQRVPFKALTVRVLQKGNLDLDGYWAAAMAKEIGFDHDVVELPRPAEFAHLDYIRRLMVDGHGTEHTWFLTMFPHFPKKSCLIFDGLAGDVFGETGFEKEEFYSLVDSTKIQEILDSIVTNELDNVLKSSFWPTREEIQQELKVFLKGLPENPNLGDFAFLSMRSRSGPGMCCQRLVPAGHVTVYPYLDLDFAIISLSFNPIDKLPPHHNVQTRCLELFWPNYYKYPGSRRIPPESKLINDNTYDDLHFACIRQLMQEVPYRGVFEMYPLLTSRAQMISSIAYIHKKTRKRIRWWLQPMLMLLSSKVNKINAICLDESCN